MRIVWLLVAILIGFGLAILLADWGSEPRAPMQTRPASAAHPDPIPDPVPDAAPDADPAPDPARAPTPAPPPATTATLLGRGVPTDPFRISWSLLASAHQSVDPLTGQLEIPAAIQALEGTWIEISGYLAAPTVLEETSEIMVTMNRWDGCCIGLPPTPFDCLETRLREPMTVRGKHAIRFGTLRGQLRIEPFAIGDTLLGLYRLESAEITTE
jgi:hypothetical protein